MALLDLAPPIGEPVDLAYAKLFLRVDGDDENALIVSLIQTARHSVENRIGRTLIRRSFLYRCAVPKGQILSLPRAPLISVERLTVINNAAQPVDIPSVDYTVSTRREPGLTRLKTGLCWTNYLPDCTRIEAEFTAGYGEAASDIPLPIRQAILLLLAQYFEHRDTAGQPPVPMMVDALLAPYRWVRL